MQLRLTELDLAERTSIASFSFTQARAARRLDDRVVCMLVVDAEEDFDWFDPTVGIKHNVSNMLNTGLLQDLALQYGAGPTYLLTYPVLQNSQVVGCLRRLFQLNQCDLGIQLHSWVNPPFDKQVEATLSKQQYSFAGNLPLPLEAEKLRLLKLRFEECFGFSPTMFRAGRYGLGDNTPKLLEDMGIEIDTSLSPRTDFSEASGPDFSQVPFQPFWFGRERSILEVPLCREIVGWAGVIAPNAYRLCGRRAVVSLRLTALLSATRMAERITLSPEGNNLAEMTRLIRKLYRNGSRTFVISFHSSSLVEGQNPYVGSMQELNAFYDSLSGVLDYLKHSLDAKFIRLRDLPLEFI